MNRNSESTFSELPQINISRSVMNLSHGYTTTLNCGDLIPCMCLEVLAGDTFEINTSIVCRAQTMVAPVMANLNIDYYYFFVPFTHMWEHFPEFFGENRQSAWVQTTEYQIPTISAPSGGFVTNSLADYFKYPVYIDWSATDVLAPSALPFRGYALIADQWFRDQNVSDPLNIPLGDSNQTGSNGSNYINDVANGGMPFKVAKYHDYFTSALPDVQKSSSPVTLNGVPSVSGMLPVGTMDDSITATSTFGSEGLRMVDPAGTALSSGFHRMELGKSSADSFGTVDYISSTESASGGSLTPINLFADSSAVTISGVSFTINELRLAYRLQRFYEIQATHGSRMIEVIKAHFGVTSLDARVQRTEYLGGKRVPLLVHEVTNTAQTSNDFLGDVGAKLATSDVDSSVLKSFTEPGYLYMVAAIRYPHVYSQGIPKQFLRKKFDQFYWPVMAGIGEQPIYDAELYADSTTIANDTVFGYQQAYSDYKYHPSAVTGEMRPGITGSLAYWNLSDYYTQKPTLSDGWIREDAAIVDRTLAVGSSVSNQFFLDVWFDIKATRPMPYYSVPGMVDRH